MTEKQVRKLLKERAAPYDMDDFAEMIGVNSDYLRQQIAGSRKIGMRALRYLGIKRVTTVTYEVIK